MKYDIGDINKLCKEHPLNSVWQIIDMGTGKVFPVTGFSGSFGDTSFSCHYTQKEGSKQQTSKDVLKKLADYIEDTVIYCTIWEYVHDGKECFWVDFHVRNITYCDRVFTLFVDSRTRSK